MDNLKTVWNKANLNEKLFFLLLSFVITGVVSNYYPINTVESVSDKSLVVCALICWGVYIFNIILDKESMTD